MSAFVKNYCGFPVDVVEVKGYKNDAERGLLVSADVRYPDGFVVGALLKASEIVAA
jgi:hypothetical protein